MKTLLLISIATLALAACSKQQPAATDSSAGTMPASTAKVPAGAYTLDKAHASIVFRVNHVGFSQYTAQFKAFDAQLQFDPANLSTATVTATVDPRSLDLTNPPPGFVEELIGEHWLESAKFPQMTFKSTKVEATASNKARMTGDFTLHGVTKPVSLDVTFNGGYDGHPMDPHARIGFSAHGSLKRSEFGVSYGIPEPGSTMGVSDAVEIIIEAEFSGPPLPAVPPAEGEKK